jgi:hypothetical protein
LPAVLRAVVATVVAAPNGGIVALGHRGAGVGATVAAQFGATGDPGCRRQRRRLHLARQADEAQVGPRLGCGVDQSAQAVGGRLARAEARLDRRLGLDQACGRSRRRA